MFLYNMRLNTDKLDWIIKLWRLNKKFTKDFCHVSQLYGVFLHNTLLFLAQKSLLQCLIKTHFVLLSQGNDLNMFLRGWRFLLGSFGAQVFKYFRFFLVPFSILFFIFLFYSSIIFAFPYVLFYHITSTN